MNRAKAQESLDASFERYIDKLIDVLMTDIGFDQTKTPEYVANFHRGLANADHAHEATSAELDRIFTP
jgi:hypothetical protein